MENKSTSCGSNCSLTWLEEGLQILFEFFVFWRIWVYLSCLHGERLTAEGQTGEEQIENSHTALQSKDIFHCIISSSESGKQWKKFSLCLSWTELLLFFFYVFVFFSSGKSSCRWTLELFRWNGKKCGRVGGCVDPANSLKGSRSNEVWLNLPTRTRAKGVWSSTERAKVTMTLSNEQMTLLSVQKTFQLILQASDKILLTTVEKHARSICTDNIKHQFI